MLLEGKNAIITGSGSGVGRTSAIRFAEEGAQVLCADLNAEGAAETVDQIEAAGGTAVAVTANVAEEADVEAMIAAAVDHFGRLDILFNNVGIPTPRLGALLEEHTIEDFQRLTAVNLGGVFLGCKHAVLQFKKQGDGGVILNTGSVAGLVGWGGTVYGATKGGVHQLTKAVAIEAAPFGIRANAICPGFIATDITAGKLTEEMRTAVLAGIPMGRAGEASDVAGCALFLASSLSAYVTGSEVDVNGGSLIH